MVHKPRKKNIYTGQYIAWHLTMAQIVGFGLFIIADPQMIKKNSSVCLMLMIDSDV